MKSRITLPSHHFRELRETIIRQAMLHRNLHDTIVTFTTLATLAIVTKVSLTYETLLPCVASHHNLAQIAYGFDMITFDLFPIPQVDTLNFPKSTFKPLFDFTCNNRSHVFFDPARKQWIQYPDQVSDFG